MSRNAPRSALEGIDHVPFHRRAQMRLQGLAVDHVNRYIEQTCNVIFQFDVIEKSDVGLGIDIDYDIEVAVRPVLAPCHGAEHGGMRDAARAQHTLMAAQS